MPLIREDKNVIVQRDAKGTNFDTGRANPRMDKVDPVYAGNGIADGIRNLWANFSVALDKNRKDAQAQGALDAQTYDTPLDKKVDEDGNEYTDADRAKDKQSWLVADAYQEGFVSAAVNQELNKQQHESAARAQNAGLSGYSTEQWLEEEKQATANGRDKIAEWVEVMPAEAKLAAANQLANNAELNYKLFSKAREGQAIVVEKRSLVAAGTAAQADSARVAGAGADYDTSLQPIMDYFNRVQTSSVISQKDKDDLVTSTAVTLAQRSTDPEFIQALTNKVYEKFGNTSAMAALNKTLYSEYKDKASRYEGQMYMQFRDQVEQIQQLPMNQRAGAMASLKGSLVNAYASRRISLGTLVSMTDGMYKPAKQQASAASSFNEQVQSGDPISLASIQKQNPDLSFSKVTKMVKDYATLSTDNAMNVLRAGQKSGDLRMVDIGLDKLSEHVKLSMNNLSYVNDKTGSIPKESLDSLQSTLKVVSSIDAGDSGSGRDLGIKQFLDRFSPDQRTLLEPILLDGSGNMANNLWDAIKINNVRAEQNKNVPPTIPDAVTKSVIDSNYGFTSFEKLGNTLGRWGTNSTEYQHQLRVASQEAYSYARKTGLLTGDAESDGRIVNSIIKANSAVLDIKQDSGSTIPVVVMGRSGQGNPLIAQAKEAGVDVKFVSDALTNTIASTLKTQVGADNGLQSVRQVQITPSVVGSHSADYNVDVSYVDRNGMEKRISNITLPKSFITDAAREAYNNRAVETEAIADKAAGAAPLSVFDRSPSNGISGNRMEFASIKGASIVKGMSPADSNELVANILNSRQFYSKPHNGIVGFGQKATSDATTTPQEAVEAFKTEFKASTVPAVKKLMRDNKMVGDADAFSVLAELHSISPKLAEETAVNMRTKAIQAAPRFFQQSTDFNKLSQEQKERLGVAVQSAMYKLNDQSIYSNNRYKQKVNLED